MGAPWFLSDFYGFPVTRSGRSAGSRPPRGPRTGGRQRPPALPPWPAAPALCRIPAPAGVRLQFWCGAVAERRIEISDLWFPVLVAGNLEWGGRRIVPDHGERALSGLSHLWGEGVIIFACYKDYSQLFCQLSDWFSLGGICAKNSMIHLIDLYLLLSLCMTQR